MTHSAPFVIRTKRDGERLSDSQIDWFIQNYTDGVVADEQAAALAMAIFLNGMAADELARWTAAMINSGIRLDLSGVGKPSVDKHSTGGVGDKVSLILCPLVAACGVAVPQLSGRGLGHTGGTLDKMEAIPGWRADLSTDEFLAMLREVGAAIVAAGDQLAPADRKLYALRDVTGTVESIPLMASSIMSKKIAEGTDGLVLDVKYGSGAFLPDPDQGRELARAMVDLGEAHGVRTVALMTRMSVPLGRAVGNGVEVTESIEVLSGGGPEDLRAVTIALAEEMLALAGVEDDPGARLDDGSALDVWNKMVVAQGGDLSQPLAEAEFRREVRAAGSGVITGLDARAIGVAAWRLGAGRARKEDPVSATAGIICHAKPGEAVTAGEPVMTLHADDPARFDLVTDLVEGAFAVGDEAPELDPLILDRIVAD